MISIHTHCSIVWIKYFDLKCVHKQITALVLQYMYKPNCFVQHVHGNDSYFVLNIKRLAFFAETDECTFSPCLNGATCMDAFNSYTCSCVDGFEGINCETSMFFKN